MEKNGKAKANILKGVSKKLKKRTLIIIGIVIAICVAVGVTAFAIFWANKPFPTPEEITLTYDQLAKQGEITPYELDYFKDHITEVKAWTKLETINQADDRELAYNYINIPFTGSLWGAPLDDLGFFYAENHPDGTATLYYYLGDNAAQREYAEGLYQTNSITMMDMLVYPALCQLDETVNEITKIYYLIYDYKNIDKAEFEKAKSEAVLLWEK